jgi:dGTPase
MDSKGEYLVRNLFEAYLSNPRQLPDPVLNQYCSFKKIELERKGLPFIHTWVKERTRDYEISDPLTQKETKEIMDVISGERDGREMRLIPAKLLEKAVPYLAVDSDFVRCIADYISSMTDVFAVDEFSSLYH